MTKRKEYEYRGLTFIRYPKVVFSEKDYWNDEVVFHPTVKQIKNLLDMAYHLQYTPPPIFDMESYGSTRRGEVVEVDTLLINNSSHFSDVSPDTPYAMKMLGELGIAVNHTCGTSACAIGTAAFFGVGGVVANRSWGAYSRDAFGVDDDTPVWEYLFNGNWANSDNTSQGAAARIIRLVTEGWRVIGKDYDEEDFYADAVPLYEKYKSVILSDLTKAA